VIPFTTADDARGPYLAALVDESAKGLSGRQLRDVLDREEVTQSSLAEMQDAVADRLIAWRVLRSVHELSTLVAHLKHEIDDEIALLRRSAAAVNAELENDTPDPRALWQHHENEKLRDQIRLDLVFLEVLLTITPAQLAWRWGEHEMRFAERQFAALEKLPAESPARVEIENRCRVAAENAREAFATARHLQEVS
jgi:hypothetical protein